METLDLALTGALLSLRPPPKLTLSEWVEEEMYLPEGVSSLPGKVRLWPFQREIADAIGDPLLERVTLVKPVRVGFTTLLTGAIGSFVANDPAPILALLPTESDARDYVVSDVEPIFRASPAIADLLSGDQEEAGRNTLMSRRFAGGSLKVVAAKSPRNLRRHNVRVLFIDEADGMEVTNEGSPLLLAERRTLSFPDRKIVVGSTPVFEDTSHVLRNYAASDQRVYEVPCPECGHWNEIEWADIQWPKGEPSKAAYVCPSCGSVVEERHKHAMVSAGRWRATAPDVESHAGFRMNALVSLHANAAWGKLAEEFVAAKNDPSLLQTFTNTILAQGWKGEGDELSDGDLAARAEPFGLTRMPEEVLLITAGVDVQHDRLEVTFLGWAEDGTVFVLGHTVIWGRWEDDTTWAELNEALRTRWDHPSGGSIGVDKAAVDSGDGVTKNKVINFAMSRVGFVLAIKGGNARDADWIYSGKREAGVQLHLINGYALNTYIYQRAASEGSIRFSSDLTREWFEQFASKKVVAKYSKGVLQREFVAIPGRRHEALDCVRYAWAVRRYSSFNWQILREKIEGSESANSRRDLAKMISRMA